jgi:hypothetical protein
MSQAHLCNTFFEMELDGKSRPLISWLRSHPVITQLQFLPLLYAKRDDLILVSDLPENSDPRLHRLTDIPPELPIEHWGPSLAIAAWNPNYPKPNWDLIRTINSKIFSFTQSPLLPGAKLLSTKEIADEWIQTTKGPLVLKTPYGTAGRGHTILDPQNPSLNVKPLYTGPCIGEPWVERVLDFSTQWENGKLVGVTLFENEPNGTYKGTFAGEPEKWALDEHLSYATPLIEKLMQMGYSGNVGIDAFIYLWEGKQRLHPIVEINARKTMSWVALQTPTKTLCYTQAKNGLLPHCLTVKGKTVSFHRNLRTYPNKSLRSS